MIKMEGGGSGDGGGGGSSSIGGKKIWTKNTVLRDGTMRVLNNTPTAPVIHSLTYLLLHRIYLGFLQCCSLITKLRNL